MRQFFVHCCRTSCAAGTAYGDSAIGNGTRINVEYVSANPTGPMHIGHCRGAVVGDALANLLAKAGYDVTKEYYINDAGAQVTALAWAAYWRYLQAIGTPLSEADFSEEVPGGLQYRGEYLIPIGERLAEQYGTIACAAGWRHRGTGSLARHRARLHHRGDDAGDPRGPAPARRRTGRVQLGARVDRKRRGRRVDRMVAFARTDLRGRARSAQGQDARRLGTAAADAVPRHAVRRRRRSAAAQIRWLQHVFCQRHRLSRRQGAARLRCADRRAGRRPRRLREAHAGGGEGAVAGPHARSRRSSARSCT